MSSGTIITKSGDVSGQVWDSGTYYISGSISVSANDSLVINPGAVIKFESSRYLLVRGIIVVNGNKENKVIYL